MSEEKNNEQVEPIIENSTKGKPKVVKKNIISKVIGEFIDVDDIPGILKFAYREVLKPRAISAGKDFLHTLVDGGYGNNRYSNYGPKSHNNPYTNYNKIANNVNPPVMNNYDTYDFEEYIFDNQVDAVEVLNRLIDIIREYNYVTVGDYYDEASKILRREGYTVVPRRRPSDRDWGWSDLSNAKTTFISGGHGIRLPRVNYLGK